MKRLILGLALCWALSGAALAEPVGRTQNGYIHRYTAENGQELYYVSDVEEPAVSLEDVNFDGHADIVVNTVQGASNGYWEFFVWDGAQYVLATHNFGPYGLPNYQLYPDKGLVSASVNNGNAGLLQETTLYCWEGTALRVVRSAVSAHPEGFSSEGGLITQTTDTGLLEMRVTEPGEEGEPVVLWEETLDLEQIAQEESAWLQTLQEVLFSGL